MFAKPMQPGEAARLEKLIASATKIVVTCHVKPDGDAVGSTLALAGILNRLDKDVYVVTPDAPPQYLSFLPGFKDIVPFSANTDYGTKLLNEAGLIFCLDFNAPYRVDRMEQPLMSARAPRVLIDHHLSPEKFCEIEVSHPEDSSTCFLLYTVLCQLALKPLVDKDIATCIAAGMMTDTGNFSYNANNPENYLVMAELLHCGIDKTAIWERLNIKSEWQLRLNGYALSKKMRLLNGERAALMQLDSAELKQFHYSKGDLEGLVNVPLQIKSVGVSVLMHQEPGFIKVSMRSQGKIPVNEICEKHFSGGGHLNAAGGEFKGTMEEAAAILEKVLPSYNRYYNKQ